MEKLKQYIAAALGYQITPDAVQKKQLNRLPVYLNKIYRLSQFKIMGHDLLLAGLPVDHAMTVSQIQKHFLQLKKTLGMPVILTTENLPAVIRRRLIEKKINFIVPGKQIFLPDLMIDLRERFTEPQIKKEKLLPSAQVIILYRILNRSENIERLSFKQLAAKLNYTAMSVTKAVKNLILHDFITLSGNKEKFLRFNQSIPDLWKQALPFMVNPVLKKCYADHFPEHLNLLRSGEYALPAYSDLNESAQACFAVGKNLFYDLRKKRQWRDLNDHEGKYCLEVWKYDPALLTGSATVKGCVDPLSLFLNLRDMGDERINMALEKMIGEYKW